MSAEHCLDWLKMVCDVLRLRRIRHESLGNDGAIHSVRTAHNVGIRAFQTLIY